MSSYSLYQKYKAEVSEETLNEKLLAIFGDTIIKGAFIMKNGAKRIFKGRLIPNTRTNKSICFEDFAKKAIRSISVSSPHIILESDDVIFELKNERQV
tara:strand:- start:136 stop:429 length:294 start_codon:yes stop_codon:yes gene_type:complete